jgi:chromosome segregation ATPase
MRRLRTIVIEGFKTFARPTILDLSEGMTAVVGPNGSGKSNLVDAIAWAVGSRSSKSLRGADMEDVIFHGAQGLPAAERAVVRLVFNNADRALPLDMEDVEVAREIHRSMGAQASINRVEARLKDLQGLLAGTGLVGGFSIVRQGTVDRLILAPPEELGRWIEEAADIARFRGRKREALDRLEKVRMHLEEGGRRIDSIRRELRRVKDRAAEARKRKELEDKLSTLARRIAACERRELLEAIGQVEAGKAGLPEEEARLRAERESLLAERSRLEDELARGAFPEPPTPPPPPEEPSEVHPIAPEILSEKVGRIRSTAIFIGDLAARLEEEGPEGWTRARRGIDRTIEMLREVKDVPTAVPVVPPPPPPAPAGPPPSLVALRRVSQELERIDERRGAIAREISRRDQDRARLEERLALLGPEPQGGEGLPEGFDLEATRAEGERLRVEIGRIGPVDETAAEREAELLHDFETAKASIQDLETARDTLYRFTAELETLAAQVFRNTLKIVEERFREYFEVLFGGGSVRLRLATPAEDPDPQDPSGGPIDLRDESKSPPVEIYVKLPCKAESALTLLSGGERSLTGIALVLALAAGESGEGKGGKLLILDEVDAALDQANAARFARLVSKLAEAHQILCVTHTSPTIHEASRMIGITSGSPPGTSILVEAHLAKRREEERTPLPALERVAS